MPNCTWTIRWTPDGVITQRIIDGEIVAESREATIEGALAGLAIALCAEEEAYEFPKAGYPTQRTSRQKSWLVASSRQYINFTQTMARSYLKPSRQPLGDTYTIVLEYGYGTDRSRRDGPR